MKHNHPLKRILSMMMAVLMLATFMVTPASAMGFDDLETAYDISDQGSYEDPDSPDPWGDDDNSDSSNSSGGSTTWPPDDDDDNWSSGSGSESSQTDEEQESSTPEPENATPSLGQSGEYYFPESGVITFGSGAGNGMARAASTETIYYRSDWTYRHVWPFSGGTQDFPIYLFYTSAGKTAYCIEPAKFNSQNGHAVTGSLTYSGLSTAKQSEISRAVAANTAGHNDVAKYAATQAIIWEIAAGQSHRSGTIYKAVIERNGLSSQYEGILSAMKTLNGEIPSFMSGDKNNPEYHMMTESGGKWSVTLNNNNSAVTLQRSDFVSIAALTFQVSGNSLTVTSDNEPGSDTFVSWPSGENGNPGVIFWLNSSIQDKITVDAVPGAGYMIFNRDFTPPPDEPDPEVKVGYLQIRKSHAFDNTPLSGAQFTIDCETLYMEGWEIDGSDVLAIPLPEGEDSMEVRITETRAPDGFQLDSTTRTVTLVPQEVMYVVTHDVTNTPEPGELVIYKHERGKSDVPLSGATFRIRFSSPRGKEFEHTYTTGADGYIRIEIPCEGTAVITELVAPSGYQLSETTEWTRIFTNGQSIRLEVENPKNAQLVVYKRDNQSGALLGGAEIHAYLEESFTEPKIHGVEYVEFTEAGTGKATFNNLIPGLYKVWEERPPANYNGTTEIFNVRVEDDSVETVEVTFHNDPYTGIAAVKVDENDPEKRLMGAVFALYRGADENKTLIKEVTTDQNGIAHFGVQPVGFYYTIVEKTPPYGYELDEENSRVIFLEAHQGNELVTLVYKNPPKPKFLLIKENMEGERLVNAVFALRKVGTDEVYHITTGADGTVLTENLSEGFWQILEVRSPEGHLIDDSWSEPFELKRGITHTITAQNARKPSLRLLKTDENGKPLANAVFVLAKEDSNEYIHLTSGSDGYANADNLEATWYTLREIRSPEGMVLSDEEVKLTFEPNQVLEYTFVNYSEPKMRIRKVDEQHPDQGIEGVTIRILPEDQKSYRDYVTGPGGYIELTLEPGRYYYQEQIAAPGYILDEGIYTFVVEEGKPDYTLQITNRKKPSLTIYKYCSVTKQPLQASFEVKVKNGRTLGTYSSDPETGLLVLDELEYETDPLILEIVEVLGPDGYLITDERKEITVRWGENPVIEWPNTPENPILIYKSDVDGNPVPNTEFYVTKVDGTAVGTYRSGINGFAVVAGQQPGWYIVQETRVSSPEFILNSEPVLVQLRYGSPAEVRFVNNKIPTLEIVKLNKADNSPMSQVLIRVQKMNGELIGDFRTDDQGRITLQTEPGWVRCFELETQPGFVLDQTPQDVLLTENGKHQVTFYNIPLPGLQLQKLDSVTLLPLKSVVYTIHRLDGSLIGQYETNDQGIIYLDIDESHVVITEIKTLDGYKIDSVPRTVALTPGALTQVVYKNIPYPILEIVKLEEGSQKPLPNARYRLYDQYMREIGTYKTNALGRIVLTGMSEGKFYLQEVEAPTEQHVKDETVHEITLRYGQTTTIELYNRKMGSFRLRKISSEDSSVLADATFLFYDTKNNVLFERTTNQYGLIEFNDELEPQTLRIREIRSPDGFVLDDKTVHEVVIKAGETTELVVKNTPEKAQVQVIKVAGEKSTITKAKKGDGLAEARFEIFDDRLNLVDVMVTDKRGYATSDPLPLGKYMLKEVESPDFFYTDGKPIYFELKLHDELIRFTIENLPEEIEVSVEKRGILECMPGDIITYEFSEIANRSNCDLDEFFWHDLLPTDALRIQSLTTGTWNQRVTYDVYVRTNLKSGWKRVKTNLHSNTSYTIDLTPSALKLASNEYVTEFKLDFGSVEPGFQEDKQPYITCKVLENLPDGYRFTNKTDVGGKRNKDWAVDQDSWTTVIWQPKKKLPKTGF